MEREVMDKVVDLATRTERIVVELCSCSNIFIRSHTVCCARGFYLLSIVQGVAVIWAECADIAVGKNCPRDNSLHPVMLNHVSSIY